MATLFAQTYKVYSSFWETKHLLKEPIQVFCGIFKDCTHATYFQGWKAAQAWSQTPSLAQQVD